MRLMTRFRPINQAMKKSESIDRFFDSFIDEFVHGNPVKEMQGSGFKVDIQESETDYLLIAELPGYEQAEIDINYQEKYLTISALKNREKSVEEEYKCIRKERVTGKLSRSFYIDYIKEESIEAKLSNGLLYVRLKKQFI